MISQQNLTGFLLINKPKGISSFDCIRKIKKILPNKTRIGHSGTLDVFASGLLIICIGREATKNVNNLMDLDKKYFVKAKIGELTDTLDYTGNILKIENVFQELSESKLEIAINSLGKSYIQIPPVCSALKYQGEPLYKLLYSGHDLEKLENIAKSKQREVKIYSVKILETNSHFFLFNAHVSKGTYVRSLANDIAQKLNTFATTYELERTSIGKVNLEQAVKLEEIISIETLIKNLIDKEKFNKLIL